MLIRSTISRSLWTTFEGSRQHRYIICRLHTLRNAIPQRMPLPPRIVLQMGLFRRPIRSLKSALHKVLYSLLPVCSNAQVEGQITCLELLKRQMYGKAHFDFLRRRVLHAV